MFLQADSNDLEILDADSNITNSKSAEELYSNPHFRIWESIQTITRCHSA